MNYPNTDIVLHEKSRLGEIKTYLENKGEKYFSDIDEFNEMRQSHYFLGNSVVFIREFTNMSKIQILSTDKYSLSNLKSSLEKIAIINDSQNS